MLINLVFISLKKQLLDVQITNKFDRRQFYKEKHVGIQEKFSFN